MSNCPYIQASAWNINLLDRCISFKLGALISTINIKFFYFMLQTQQMPSSVNPAAFHLLNSFSAHSKWTPFQEQISRTFPGWFFQDSEIHINPFTPTQDLNVNSLYSLRVYIKRCHLWKLFNSLLTVVPLV